MGSSDRTSLGDRMKKYEAVTSTYVTPRTPVIIRLDGKAFHSYTRSLPRPWSEEFIQVMDIAALEVCSEVQGAELAYVQSDEISVLIHTYKNFESLPWLSGRIQKMVSVAASVAGAVFTANSHLIWKGDIRPAYFDCRAFCLPEAEVCNYFLWRQQDCTRNSVQMLARSLYSHKECNNKKGPDLQEMCFARGHNWNDLPARHKRGRCAVVATTVSSSLPSDAMSKNQEPVVRRSWAIDNEIPVFSQDRWYIEKHLATHSPSDH